MKNQTTKLEEIEAPSPTGFFVLLAGQCRGKLLFLGNNLLC
ncbi:hypothetical protein [Terrimonas ginsenosidimutans]|nr:hypothetical protein [Terrimonas ginsenosidimutans]